MSVFYNSSQSFGILIDATTQNITGSLFLTLLLLVIIILAFLIMFRIPIEYSVIFIMPLLLVIMAYTGEFLAVGGIALLYLGTIAFKYFFIE